MIAKIYSQFHLRWKFASIMALGCLVSIVYLAAYRVITRLDPNRPISVDIEKYLHNDDISERHAIPKIIHQVWTDEILPDQFVKHVQSIVKYNPSPEWEYFFWTHKIGLEFIKENYPKLQKIYEASEKITKADILRILVIYHYGGAYFDLDIVGVRPLDRYVENHECSLVGPIPEYYVAYDQEIDYRNVNNAILLCRARHPFFELLVKRTEIRSESCNETCPSPEFPAPLLIELTDKGEDNIVPEIVDYRLFDSKYDLGITELLTRKCSGDYYHKLEPAKQDICDEWKRHGKSESKVYENAYTFHTWYHANARRYTIDPKNVISNIVPHAKMYNSLLHGHYRKIK